ncbi:MAG: thioredoxin domain-containing protein [Clostridiales bacterium]
MLSEKKVPNRLANEKSPYLLQHAYNPVDWYPWGEEAFQKAKEEDKPVFLSIGYSTCHWCHVMAHESFEDQEVAERLNRDFMPVKVDREVRPDVDEVYMNICQMITGQGGWPLTVVMTPEQKPFYVGTYFPKKSRHGMPGLLDILDSLAEHWRENRQHVEEVSRQWTEILQEREQVKSQSKAPSKVRDNWQQRFRQMAAEQILGKAGQEGNEPAGYYDPSPRDFLNNDEGEMIKTAYEQLKQSFDAQWGGFGPPPKFPCPSQLLFLLHYHHFTKDEEALAMVEKTLEQMYRGGIFDHIGFGFSRYSTDRQWLAPHFEKMLYDNALLAMVYTEAWQITKRPLYKVIACKTLDYALRELGAAEGGFFSAQDADSQGEEGKYYVFTPAEILELLGKEDGEYFNWYFDITEKGNFEGKNIPNLIGNPEFDQLKEWLKEREAEKEGESSRSSSPDAKAETGAKAGAGAKAGVAAGEKEPWPIDGWGSASADGTNPLIQWLAQQVYAYRLDRMELHLDDKILTAWNGLMAAALIKAYQAFGWNHYLEAARKTLVFVEEKLFSPQGRLLVSYHKGEEGPSAAAAGQGQGLLDDYSFLIWAQMEMYAATFELVWLERALELNDILIREFWDEERGGFYMTSSQGEKLISRPKPFYDGAMPAGNSVAALNLLRLARLTGRQELRDKFDEQIEAFAGAAAGYPAGHCFYLIPLMLELYPEQELICTLPAKKGESDIALPLEQRLKAILNRRFRPELTVLVKERAEENTLGEIAPFSKDYPLAELAGFYLCSGKECQPPCHSLEELAGKLDDLRH